MADGPWGQAGMIRNLNASARGRVTTLRIDPVERICQEAQAASEAAAKAIALRPIPPEAIRSGATVAASIAEKRARRYRTCAQCGGDCAPELNWADDLGVRVMYVCPQHGVHSVIDPHEHRRRGRRSAL